MSSDVIIEIRDVSKIYERGEEQVHALRHVVLDVIRGEYLSIMGPSGSGKSTLFNMVGGLDTPTSGSVFIEGFRLAELKSSQLAWVRCNKIGFIWEGNLVAYDTPQGIKDNFNLYQIIKIQCKKINEVFKLLQGHELIKDINIYGDALHLAVDSAEEAMPALNHFLQDKAIKINEMNTISPSIEDVFVALSKQTN